MALLSVLAAPFWSVGIAVAVGNTGVNMASSVGKLMIILYAAWLGDPSHAVPTLALGALSIAVIDQALDLVRDFKTAHLVGGVSPKTMLLAQVIGALLSCVVAPVAYLAMTSRQDLPSKELPCVIAQSYRALAVVFSEGVSALPQHCALISACFAAAALCNNLCMDLLPGAHWLPSSAAVGVGMYLGAGQILGVFAGTCVKLYLVRVLRYNPNGLELMLSLIHI
eukprot:TRINITY_DN14722_c0_g1_i1.p3 TRINITY_DN14722_c0_g1~~TRINITY_DN14722_c0_g1_i1.p3  ORF type:complete len:224 (+),score=58.33 TRINITY_DN14722_c0_g1_i1:152-823(+)